MADLVASDAPNATGPGGGFSHAIYERFRLRVRSTEAQRAIRSGGAG